MSGLIQYLSDLSNERLTIFCVPGNDPYSFGRTTIANLKQGYGCVHYVYIIDSTQYMFKVWLVFCFHSNNLLWLHTVFAVLYLVLTVALLRRHTSKMKGTKREIVSFLLFLSLSFTDVYCQYNRSFFFHRLETHCLWVLFPLKPVVRVLKLTLCKWKQVYLFLQTCFPLSVSFYITTLFSSIQHESHDVKVIMFTICGWTRRNAGQMKKKILKLSSSVFTGID